MNSVRLQGSIKETWVNESLLYLAASAVALGVDFGVYTSLIHLGGVFYQWAALIGFGGGVLVVYALSVKMVFRNRSVEDKRKEFMVFCGIGVLGLGLNNIILYVAVSEFQRSFEVAKLCSVCLVFVFNFSLRKALLFSKGRQ